MKKILPLVLILVVLSGAYLLFFQPKGPDNEFHITDAKAVAKVELEKVVKGEKEKKLVLEQDGSDPMAIGWKIDGKYTALLPKVEDFLLLLTQIRVAKPMEEKSVASSLALLKRNHTRVTIFDHAGEVLKEYLVGATNQQQTSNIMMIAGADKPYYVNRPGHVGYVSVMYNVNDYEWREKLLWNLKAEQLLEVSTAYDTIAGGFTLRRSSPAEPWVLADGSPAAADKAEAYLSQFQGKVFAESFAGLAFPELMDSLAKRRPDVKLSYKTLEGQSDTLFLFGRPENLNNFFGYMAKGRELYTVQHHVIDKFLRKAAFFGVVQ